MIEASTPPSSPHWCADGWTAHLYTGTRAACGRRWYVWTRRLRPGHTLIICQSCAKAERKP